ncbi:MAG: hypothetical protein ACUZ8N_06680 [Candidatus Scalindua sp.]
MRNIQARDVAEGITSVIARGTTEEVEVKGKIKELSQRPLEPDEAYKVAIEMLIASLEPLLMQHHAIRDLEKLMDTTTSIAWLQDFVEKSPISPENTDSIDLPYVEDIGLLESDLKRLIELLGEV